LAIVGAQRATAPVLSGVVPPLADPYLPRVETGFGLAEGLRPGETIVLARKESADPEQVTEGIGKTQLAIGFAHAAWNAGAVDLLVWVPASSRESIIASYAQAASEIDAGRHGEIADAAAARLLDWLSRTQRRWALILDDLQSVADLEGLWPQGRSGQVLITTRLNESEVGAPGRTVVGVEPFSRREALGYLSTRLTGHPDQRIESLDLAEDLGAYPISLALAAAQIMEADITARDYRAQYIERQQATAGSAAEGWPPSMLASWSLSVERAHQVIPDGLAWPMLVLTAMLSTSGIPAAVLTSPAACGYIMGRPSEASATDQNLIRSAFGTLENLGLIGLDKTSGARTIWMHSAVQAAVRAYLPRSGVGQVVMAAAAALLEAWPQPGAGAAAGPLAAQLEQALRDCAASLRAYAGDLLWKPEAHPLLLRSGVSLEESLLANSGIDYWRAIAATCTHLLGPGHQQAVLARDRLAAAYEKAGRMAEAMSVFEAALADRERNLGAEHPETLTAAVSLAHSYEAAGLQAEAIGLYQETLAASDRLLGSAHRDTLAIRASLAAVYQATGRRSDAIRLYKRTLAEYERSLGAGHRDTITARSSLAAAYQSVGQTKEAIAAYQRAVADSERTLGAGDVETMTTRCNLATAYYDAGRMNDMVRVLRRALADCEQFLGPEHQMTVMVRENLESVSR
jgi:tetratricopeptide (TPR) repeat protein